MKMKYYQQGDCLLKEVETVPAKAKALRTDLLWKGQNHHHRVKGKFKIKKLESVLFVESQGAVLFHEEHKDIKLPKGIYALSIVQEYDHWLEESRAVID
jgi:hypothetical protein